MTNTITAINNDMNNISADDMRLFLIGLNAIKAGRDPYEAMKPYVSEERYAKAMAACNQ